MNSIKVSKYIYLPKTESTNQYAQELVSKSNPDDHYCIYTDNQTHGKGQFGRIWYSEPGKNLTASFIVRLKHPVLHQFDLNMIFGLSVISLVKEILPDEKMTIKWPNDIYINNNKLGGILIQNIVRGMNITHGIFGIGLNVNQAEFPSNLPNPISLKQITGKAHNRLLLLFRLQILFEEKMNFYITRTAELKSAYLSELYGMGQNLMFCNQQEEKFEGRIEGISDEGRLCVSSGGNTQAYNFREIRFIIPE
ncbi:MAG: biotin--[acetyl-CoA-carboxylase] ligase [Saprospiraceae bacterium]|nr:biotin--[acetyl-CoA-carboxylase] ligase [Saprospiraceae bacterium]